MIGVFDSGIGGLSILSQLLRLKKSLPLIYLADQAHTPYGTKPRSFVRHRTTTISSWLVSQSCNTVIIACNTATVTTPVSALRTQFPHTHFIGIEPPVKPLARLTQTGHIGLLATPLTAKSPQLDRLTAQYASSLTLHSFPTPDLVIAIEHFAPPSTIRALLQPIHHHIIHLNIDALGLACTHFSLIQPLIQSSLPRSTQIYDPSSAVANQALKHLHLPPSASPPRFITTGAPFQLQPALHNLLSLSTPVESLQI